MTVSLYVNEYFLYLFIYYTMWSKVIFTKRVCLAVADYSSKILISINSIGVVFISFICGNYFHNTNYDNIKKTATETRIAINYSRK